jgi:hypothetical protein
VRSRQIRILKHGAAQVGTRQPGMGEIGLGEVSPNHAHPVLLGILKARFHHASAGQVGIAQFCMIELRSPKLRSTWIRAGQVYVPNLA